MNVDIQAAYGRREWVFRPGELPEFLAGRQGCPQGLSASALVADAVIADVLSTFERGDARLIVYSDNIAIACRTRTRSRTLCNTLQSAFAEHPNSNGSLRLRVIHEARRADYGFEFLGYRLKKRHGRVRISPTEKNKRKFGRLYRAWFQALRSGSATIRSRVRVRGRWYYTPSKEDLFLGWLRAFTLWDRVENWHRNHAWWVRHYASEQDRLRQ
jgi:hypothetical protein